MPPRTRKTAATNPPDTEQAPLDTEPESDSGQDPAPTPEPTPGPEPLPGPTSEPAAPTVPSFHWQVVAGTAPEPCRLCFPAGPPPNAGSIGCQHGQWVRVQDGG